MVNKLERYSTVQPIAGHTGCGIVMKILDIPEERRSMYNTEGDHLYVVVTDFGNSFTLTLEEFNTAYKVVRVEEDPRERFMRQKELLREVWEEYFEDNNWEDEDGYGETHASPFTR